ncbi:MAG: aspartate-semialdehyde dehydrogenase, partial [Nitrospirota bacterium]
MLKKKNAYVVAVAGATGVVGKEMIEILAERNFPVSDLVPLASERSEGERIQFRGKNWII